jgi:hypothetical protein
LKSMPPTSCWKNWLLLTEHFFTILNVNCMHLCTGRFHTKHRAADAGPPAVIRVRK